jgi:hypothetical protein
MQDRRRQFDEIFLQRAAGPYIGVRAEVVAAPSNDCGRGRALTNLAGYFSQARGIKYHDVPPKCSRELQETLPLERGE